MNRRRVLNGLLATAACPTCLSLTAASAHAAGSGAHWGYEGHEGPEHWGSLDPHYGACSMGKEQSPINLTNAIPAMVEDLDIRWHPIPLSVKNNGHTLECAAAEGGTLSTDGTTYKLKQFHFHHPSEHVVNGMPHAMEVHFVHQADNGSLAVIGVFIRAGKSNPTLVPIWDTAPHSAGQIGTKPDIMISPMALLPPQRVTWRYAGSLTTPPCNEIVSWIVYQDPIEASPEQIKTFATLFPMNARPAQPLNRRKLLVDFF